MGRGEGVCLPFSKKISTGSGRGEGGGGRERERDLRK